MPVDFDVNALICSFVVSSIGFVLFSFGRKLGRPPQLLAGLVLLVFPYFVSSIVWMLLIAVVLLGALWVALRLGY